MSSDDPLARALRAYMDRKDIGQNKLADEHLDCSRETVNRLLQGYANPRRSTLVRLHKLLAITPDKMISGVELEDFEG